MLRGLARRAGDHGYLPMQPCRRGGGRSDRPEHSVCSRLPFYSRHSQSIPLSCRDILGIRRTVREIDLSDLVAGSEQVEEDLLVHSLLTEFKVVPVYRRFGAIVHGNIMPGTAGGQDVQDAARIGCGGHTGVGRCAASLREGISGQSPRDHRQFPEIP